MSTGHQRTQAASDSEPLTAKLRIVPPASSTCVLLEAGQQGEAIVRNEVNSPDCADAQQFCRATVTVTNDQQECRQYVSGPIDDGCVCPVYNANDCVVDIECFSAGTFFVRATVPDRDALRSLIDDLRGKNATVHLEQLLPLDQSPEGYNTVELDTSVVTEKQREAIDTAVKAGYYERPRRTDLSDLSDHLGISESAVSQRLNGAESTLIREMASVTIKKNGR